MHTAEWENGNAISIIYILCKFVLPIPRRIDQSLSETKANIFVCRKIIKRF